MESYTNQFRKGAFEILFVAVLIFFSSFPNEALGQRIIERSHILNPLENPAVDLEEDEEKWFSHVGGWGAFGNYSFARDSDHLWYQELGAYFEIFRRGNESSFAITSQIEFIANGDNDINFSPHAIIWEEGLLYTSYRGGFYLQFGYYHRCKHDIDNLESGEERASVFGSAMGRVIVPVQFSQRNDAVFSLQYDYYTITWERRIPEEFADLEPMWDELHSSFLLNGSYRSYFSDDNYFGVSGYGMSILANDGLRLNAKIGLTVGTSRGPGDVEVGIHMEHFADSGIPVRPGSVTLAGLGIRINSTGSVR